MSYLCLKRDVEEGGYNVFEAMGESYIAKKENGNLTVAKNACSHRGMRVAACSGRGPIRCGYHGQRFNFDKKIGHHEFGEVVFLPAFLGESKIITDISLEIGEEFGEHKQLVKAPFHLWLQNTADPNHLTTTHRDSFSNLFDGSIPDNVYINESESSYTMRIKDEVVERYRRRYPDASDEFRHILGFPNLSITSFLGIFYSIESANPAPGGCQVHTRFFMRRGLDKTLICRIALETNIRILQEDKALVEKWALGYKYNPETKWLQGEARIKRYADEIRTRGLE